MVRTEADVEVVRAATAEVRAGGRPARSFIAARVASKGRGGAEGAVAGGGGRRGARSGAGGGRRGSAHGPRVARKGRPSEPGDERDEGERPRAADPARRPSQRERRATGPRRGGDVGYRKPLALHPPQRPPLLGAGPTPHTRVAPARSDCTGGFARGPSHTRPHTHALTHACAEAPDLTVTSPEEASGSEVRRVGDWTAVAKTLRRTEKVEGFGRRGRKVGGERLE